MLLKDVPKLERYFRILLQNHLIATQRRLMQSMSETAEEKYLKYMQTYPDCVQRVPQHMIASFLGITRETLSRIRKQVVSKRWSRSRFFIILCQWSGVFRALPLYYQKDRKSTRLNSSH